MTSEIEKRAKAYAIRAHWETSHMYGMFPYSVHLRAVRSAAYAFRRLFPKDKEPIIFGGAWCHDIIEDARQTYNDVVSRTNVDIAELAYALTNEKGKTRAERANDKYYKGIRDTPYAVFLKLCDRIANIEAAVKMKNERMLEVYKKEHSKFKLALYTSEYGDMWRHMESVLGLRRKLTLLEEKKGRSPNYYVMSAEQQCAGDKRLGILDWDGK